MIVFIIVIIFVIYMLYDNNNDNENFITTTNDKNTCKTLCKYYGENCDSYYYKNKKCIINLEKNNNIMPYIYSNTHETGMI